MRHGFLHNEKHTIIKLKMRNGHKLVDQETHTHTRHVLVCKEAGVHVPSSTSELAPPSDASQQRVKTSPGMHRDRLRSGRFIVDALLPGTERDSLRPQAGNLRQLCGSTPAGPSFSTQGLGWVGDCSVGSLVGLAHVSLLVHLMFTQCSCFPNRTTCLS